MVSLKTILINLSFISIISGKPFNRSLNKRSINNLKRLSRLLPKNRGICGNTFCNYLRIKWNKTIKTVEIDPDFDGPEVRTRTPDVPHVNHGSGTVKIAVSIDQKLFKDRFGSDMKIAEEFVSLHLAYLQKQLRQKTLRDMITLSVVVIRFLLAPFEDVHRYDFHIYLSLFCDWAYKQGKADVHLLFTGWSTNRSNWALNNQNILRQV